MCVATKRVYVHESIYNSFLEAMVKALQSYTVGDAAEKATALGPVQNKMQYEYVKSLVDDSNQKGYKVCYREGRGRTWSWIFHPTNAHR